MPRNYTIRVTTNPDGYVRKATISAPGDGIKITIDVADSFVDYNLHWNELDVVAMIPEEYVSVSGLTADSFKETFGKPYKSVFEVLGDVDHALYILFQRAKRLDETEGLSNTPAKLSVKANEEGEVEIAKITSPEHQITIEMRKDEEEATVWLTWEDIQISVTAPLLPYFYDLFSERVIKEVFTNVYSAVVGVIATLQRIIHEYRDKAKDLAHAKEYPKGWW